MQCSTGIVAADSFIYHTINTLLVLSTLYMFYCGNCCQSDAYMCPLFIFSPPFGSHDVSGVPVNELILKQKQVSEEKRQKLDHPVSTILHFCFCFFCLFGFFFAILIFTLIFLQLMSYNLGLMQYDSVTTSALRQVYEDCSLCISSSTFLCHFLLSVLNIDQLE